MKPKPKSDRFCLLVVASLTIASVAHAQDALGGGDALDANLSATDGTRNRRAPSPTFRLRNQLVTGNIAAGRGFRDSVGYTAEFDFRGDTGSDDLFEFRADSALSSPEFFSYRATIQQLRFGQDIGLLVGFERSSTGLSLADVQSRRLPVYTTSRAEWQLNRLGTITSFESETERKAEPLLIGEVTAEDTRMLVHTSSLQGIYTMPVAAGSQIIGVTNFDLARARDDRDKGVMDYEFGSRFNTRYVPGLLSSEDNPDAPATAYDTILRTLADRYGRGVDETSPEDVTTGVDRAMNRLRGYLLELDEQRQDQGDETSPDVTAPPFGSDDDESEDGSIRTIGEILRHGERLAELAATDAGRFDELMTSGEEHLRKKEYFRAERRFEHALRITPLHPLATAGLCHAQLGAKLYQSAASTLRTMFHTTPEMIDTRYDSGIIPETTELRRIADDLQSSLPSTYDPSGYALLIAYIGHQLGNNEMIRAGLDRMEAENTDEEDRLIPLLRVVWLGQ